jgi:FkbM family methyltransferase
MISVLRHAAQAVRHAPLLRSFTPLWNVLRGPYLALVKRLGSRNGIAVVVGGVPLRLHPEFATQNWETLELESYRAFRALLRPGDVVFDIGAHIGTYTLIALKGIGPEGRVVAYEPHPLTRRYLEQHLEWNDGRTRTTVRTSCCGAVAGRATFYCVPDRAEGMNGLIPVDGFQSTVADVSTVDEEVHALDVIPSVIKIDVEGAEWDVLKGAAQTLRAYHPALSVSLHSKVLARMDATPADVLQWLSVLGYQHRIVSEDHEIHVIATAPQTRGMSDDAPH